MSLAPDHRRRELARIHILAGELGMDTADKNPQSEYRSMLWTIGRERSASALDHAGRARVIEHLEQLARLNPQRAKPRRDYGRKPIVTADRKPLVDKLEALLADARRPWSYAAAMAKRMFKIDQLEWATAEHLRGLVAALEKDRRRRAAKGPA